MGSWWDRLLGTARTRRARGNGGDAAPAVRANGGAPALDTGTLAARAPWRPDLPVDAAYAALLLGNPEPVDGDGMGFDEALPLLHDDARASLAVPRMPTVVPQLLRSLREPATSAQSLARQVAQDPVLVAAVLRRANSSYYRAGPALDSLETALLVLGHDGLRGLVASVAFQPIINVQSGRYTRIAAPVVWAQAEACGALCRLLAVAPGQRAFEAFLVALLANVGTIVALRVLDEGAPLARTPHGALTCSALLACARRQARAIGSQWGFPPTVVDAAADAGDGASNADPLLELLRVAQALSRLRVLVDAGALGEDDPRLALGGDARIARCFAAVRATAA